ncbi:hypothetical protein [Curtobacterium sp. MCPF17_051]|uniref:hypothetical protein n=1 Tax=Curtobacterium sp. MCPF17_051 TaxID=2175640 RepID=UPI0011B44034|nr:hypothetical protein [Curtobacterium sp. MCPF17_051]
MSLLLPESALKPPSRDALKALDSVDRDRLLDAEEALEREEDRFLAWCLGIEEDVGGPATAEEVARWTKRREKTAKRARKAEKAREKAARKAQEGRAEAEPVLAHRGAFTLSDEDEEHPASRAPVLPPPPRRPESGAYDEDD